MSTRDLYAALGALAALRWAANQAEDIADHAHVAALVTFIVPRVGRVLDDLFAAGGTGRTGLFDDGDPEVLGDD